MGRQKFNRIAVSAAAFAAVIGVYWLGGGDFERGFGLAYMSVVALVAAGFAWAAYGDLAA